jgi:hypothetical protein
LAFLFDIHQVFAQCLSNIGQQVRQVRSTRPLRASCPRDNRLRRAPDTG